ncbi:hypothetical protein Patl1_28823 [Pistacia atlantica]|uniref:Uncharacterized protein n=1 Tax=Pistacia atlantica TaxID=434234 RepID=A0ACC1BC05_9ROSI|nr:hypothetical protein Patl1_28823 [Pistacia atlantica]
MLAASDCNPKNYLSGRCGGTKVGALVGGLIAGASIVTVLALICYCIRRRSPSFRNQLNAKRLLFQAAGNSSVPIGRGCVDEIIDPYLEPNRDAWTLSSIHNVAELAFRCLAFHRDMRPTMTEVAEELEHIRVSSWASNIFMASPQASCCSSSDFGSERSLGSSMMIKKAAARSQRLIVPAKAVDCLATLDEVKDSSPVSVQDPWLSEQSSPSTNSLLVMAILYLLDA